MHTYHLSPARLLIIFITGALGLALVIFGFLFPTNPLIFEDGLNLPGGWLVSTLLFVVAALVFGVILGGLGRLFGRGLVKLIFGSDPGKYFLERDSRSDKALRSHLAHAAGYCFDRNFTHTFKIAFRNYFRYETAIPDFHDQLCLTALAGSDSPLHQRLGRLGLGVEIRANLAVMLLLYVVGRLIFILVNPLTALAAPVIIELAVIFFLALVLTYSQLKLQAAWYHELYISFFELAVEEDVDRPTVKLSSRRGRRSGRRRSGGSKSGNRSGSSRGGSKGGSSRRSSGGSKGGSKGGSSGGSKGGD